MYPRYTVIALSTFALLIAPVANAAYCALRDPVETITSLFPDATSHKSVIKVVGEAQRKAVSEQLAPNTLHFSELGQHTLYVAFHNQTPLGYVHVRSEESEWGLVEIAWAIDTSMRVKDFRFQRCRNRERRTLEAPDFRRQLMGKNYQELKQLLADDGMTIKPGVLDVSAKALDLAIVLIRCGLKTLLVTELAWADEVQQYGTLSRAQASFDGARTVHAISHAAIVGRYQEITDKFPGGVTAMGLSGSEVLAVHDEAGIALGAIFRHDLELDQTTETLEWHVKRGGELVAVDSVNGWRNRNVQQAFKDQLGQRFDETSSCATRTELLTKQAVLMAMVGTQPR